ncbi:hypothetical protein [Actinokineospora iranica]|uniref:hypothetical protein n=1 Tax=Actinokineospora iranica TaxID=1271860 RepID=UPI001113523F|nr:hypothetical protein [Actinokineospora iranica]
MTTRPGDHDGPQYIPGRESEDITATTKPAPGVTDVAAGPAWTWQTVLLVLTLVMSSFVFVYLLLGTGLEVHTAVLVPIGLLAVIVPLVVPTKSGNSLGRRLVRALTAFADDGQGPR